MKGLKRNLKGILISPVNTYRAILDEEPDLTVPVGIVICWSVLSGIAVYVSGRAEVQSHYLTRWGLPPWIDATVQIIAIDFPLLTILGAISSFILLVWFSCTLSKSLGGKTPFTKLFELMAYAQIPVILASVIDTAKHFSYPSSFSFVGDVSLLWALALGVLAIRESYGFSTKRAIFIYVVALIGATITTLFALAILLIGIAIILKLIGVV